MWRLEALTPSPSPFLLAHGEGLEDPHPQPLSLCAWRGEPIRAAEAWVDVLSAELASDVATESPSPFAKGEGFGVRVRHERHAS